jgi:speckle-type POZ protein
MRVNVDGMPRQAVEAFLRFVYTGTLPVVDGLSADGYRDMFWHLLLAGERYGMGRLSAISNRVLCNSIDVKSAAAMLTMAHRHGFQEIKEACVEFASDPENTTAWYSGARDMLSSCAWRISLWLERYGPSTARTSRLSLSS